ncbi:hypothetical protein BaRGS_00027936 [Batillaria attramentaria]|uniref:Uncharacterized protein n=1 Tax=Batillaria attramentaria TaxID=370345 RepID=A0ABD0K1Y1_9CAEN
MRRIRLEHLVSIVSGLRLRGVRRSRNSSLHRFFQPPPSSATLSLGGPASFFPQASTQGLQHSTIICWFPPQHMADPVPPSLPHFVTGLLFLCHLQNCFV